MAAVPRGNSSTCPSAGSPRARRPRIRIVLVDDEPDIRQGLRMCLELDPQLTIVGEAGDGQAALELVRTLKPDIVVMDISMPGLDGITTTQYLHLLAPRTAVIMLSIHENDRTREQARSAGAVAYVGKYESSQVLLEAIRQAGHEGSKSWIGC